MISVVELFEETNFSQQNKFTKFFNNMFSTNKQTQTNTLSNQDISKVQAYKNMVQKLKERQYEMKS